MNESIDVSNWRTLSDVLGKNCPFLDKTLYLEGFDISSNIYVIVGDYLTVIDPGNDYTAYSQLFSLGFTPDQIKKVILTHGHREHVVGLFELFRYQSIRESGGIEVILHETGPEGVEETINEYKLEAKLSRISGGEKLDLGGVPIEIIHTPGHTMDSICIYHRKSRSLFTGDTVLPNAVSSPDPTAGGRPEYQLFSVKGLLSKEVENILPGHGPPFGEDIDKVLRATYGGIIRKMVGLETPWENAAEVFIKKGYLEECIYCCDKALEDGENNVKALTLKGTCLNDMGRYSDAHDIFDTILSLVKDNYFALIGKGFSLMGMEKYDESLQYFDRVLKIIPNYREAEIYKGIALYLSGRKEEALSLSHFKEELIEKFKDALKNRD